jgi:hypothetical protein
MISKQDANHTKKTPGHYLNAPKSISIADALAMSDAARWSDWKSPIVLGMGGCCCMKLLARDGGWRPMDASIGLAPSGWEVGI